MKTLRLLLVCCLVSGGSGCGFRSEKRSGDEAQASGQPSFGLDDLAQRYEELGRFSGAVAMAVEGELLFAGGYGLADRDSGTANTVNTVFDLGSLSKQFTTAAILKLEAEGKLRIEDSVSVYLPDYPRPQGELVTIHHLLNHTSGIPSLWRLGDGLEEVEATTEPISLDELVDFFDDRELLFDPGERFRYSNSGYVLLAAIIEAVTQLPYQAYLEKALFEPLGMERTGCRRHEDGATPYHGYPPHITVAEREHPSWSVGDGCVSSTVSDLLVWGAALMGDDWLPAEQREKLFARHATVRPGTDYGYGWFLSESHGRDAVHHSGASEGIVAEMYLFPGEGLTVIALANYAPRLGINAPRAIIEQATSLYFGLPIEMPPRVVQPLRSKLEAFSGRYAMARGGSLEVNLLDDGLWIGPVDEGPGVFDYGVLPEPTVIERAGEVGMEVVRAARADDFEAIRLCPDLVGVVPVSELRSEWSELLAVEGALQEMELASVGRYPGDETLLVTIGLQSTTQTKYFSLDLTPSLVVCGWYGMDSEEFEIRRAMVPPRRAPMLPTGPEEFYVDGFNYSEPSVTAIFRTLGESSYELVVEGENVHAGRPTQEAHGGAASR